MQRESQKASSLPLINRSVKDMENFLSYSDLGGLDPQIRVLQEYESYIQKTIGTSEARAIKGRLLLIGPPGTGKTVVARALAKSLGWQFAELDISTIVSSYLGETPKLIASVFRSLSMKAQKRAKTHKEGYMLFLDEFDSIGSSRASTRDHQEIARAVNALLVGLEESQFEQTGLFVICATNLVSQLDPALLRRFDSIIEFPMPNIQQKTDILKKIVEKLELNSQLIDVSRLAELTDNFSPSDLHALIGRGVFKATVDPNITVDTSLFAQLIENREIVPSNIAINRTGVSVPTSNTNPSVLNTHEPLSDSSTYLDVLLHAVLRDRTRGPMLLDALDLLEEIPYDMRLELYYLSHGRVLGEERPAGLIRNRMRKGGHL